MLEDVERNYRLYGLDVRFAVDDELDDADLSETVYVNLGYRVGMTERDYSPPIIYTDAQWIRGSYHDDRSKAYMFVSTEGGYHRLVDWTSSGGGSASSDGSDRLVMGKHGLGFGAVLFTDKLTGSNPPELHMQKTTVHEIGHLFGEGIADDEREYVLFPDEVYSGRDDDPTKEYVRLNGDNWLQWSVMSGGWNPPLAFSPMNGDYIAFSIEELSTLNFDNIDTVDDR